MADTKLELEKLLNGKKWHRNSNFYPYIFDSDMTLSTLYNVGQLPKFKIARLTKPEAGVAVSNSVKLPTSDNVGSVGMSLA